MSSRNMTLDVIVRMRDLMSGPLRGLRSTLNGVASFSQKIGVVGAAIAGLSFLAPIDQAAAFEQKLLDIAGTMELTRDAAFSFVAAAKSEYEELALSIGQYSSTVAEGAGAMIAAGVDKSLIDASIGSIGRAATAANAEFSDMTSVATSLLQTLRVPADQLDDSLGALVTAGKLGSFELKDMARYFPTLTSQMTKFGVSGREAVNFLASALQIARKGTADPAEAANNLKNFLAKILAPATIKNFRDAGVDIEAVMRDAATKGINPIEAVVQKISKLTGMSGAEIDGLMQKAKANGLEGAEALGYVREQLEKIHGAGKLGEIFGDMQVMDFLIPMLANIEEYKQIKEEVAAATGGLIDDDFKTQMKGLNKQMMTFREISSQAIREVGLAFGTWLPLINENLMAALKWLRETDKATGGMVTQALAFAGAALMLTVVLGGLGIALRAVGSGVSAFLIPIRGSARAVGALSRYFANAARSAIGLQAALAGMDGLKFGSMARLATGLRGMLFAIPGISSLSGVLSAIGAALAGISAPVWGLIAAIAALIAAIGVLIYKYWEPISNFLAGFGSVVATAAGEALAAIGGFASGVATLAGQKLVDLAAWLGFDEASIGEVLASAGKLADDVWQFFADLPGKAGSLFAGLFSMNDYSDEAEAGFRDAGERAGRAMVEAIKGAFSDLFDWFRNLGKKILDAIGSIDLSSVISWPSLPSWMGGGSAGGATPPANENMLPAQGGQQTTLNGQIDLNVTGPAEVTSVSSENSGVSIKANTGRTVGRF